MERFLRFRLAEESKSYTGAPAFRPALTISRHSGIGMSRIGPMLADYLEEVDDSAEAGWALV